MAEHGGCGIARSKTTAGMVEDTFMSMHSPMHVYPDLADPIVLTSHADAWTLGDAVVVIPADTITDAFSIAFVDISAISGNDDYQLEMYENGNVMKCTFAKSPSADPVRPLPVHSCIMAPNTQITAKLANKTAATTRTCSIKLWYSVH